MPDCVDAGNEPDERGPLDPKPGRRARTKVKKISVQEEAGKPTPDPVVAAFVLGRAHRTRPCHVLVQCFWLVRPPVSAILIVATVPGNAGPVLATCET